jgi:predicted enzyme related to lactoylglutathione lyase
VPSAGTGRKGRKLSSALSAAELAGINFRVNDAREHAARLVGLGATWIRPVEPEPFGLLGTIADPDGNYVQIAQVTRASSRIDQEISKEAPAASR